MRQHVFNPVKSGTTMKIVCFISGSGTNYREIVSRDPAHKYLIFTNRPGCGGEAIAREFGHEVVQLSHLPYFEEARKKYGTGSIPRNCPERLAFEQKAIMLIEEKLGGQADLICLAGYDLWSTDWLVDRYYPRILNVHPGDTTRGYTGLHWIPAAKAIIAGEASLRSTLFFVDKGGDTGPVLVQSAPLIIEPTLSEAGADLKWKYLKILDFIQINNIKTFAEFKLKSDAGMLQSLERICTYLQDQLKMKGDWQIYPYAVHDLIAKGRIEVDGRDIYLDGNLLPEFGFRLD